VVTDALRLVNSQLDKPRAWGWDAFSQLYQLKGGAGARSHCRFALLLNHLIPDSLRE
jgi:hypothetical protein